jgi:hypothetical protein
MINPRTTDASGQERSHGRQRGRYLDGKVPFGFRIGSDGELVPDDG